MEDVFTNNGDDEKDEAAAEVVLLPEAGDHDEADEGDMIAYGGSSESMTMMKRQIASHPHYPTLVSSHIDCQKVGAPLEVLSLLEDITDITSLSSSLAATHNSSSCSTHDCHMIMINDHMFGGAHDHHPKLDHFMESYCELLHGYKVELTKSFQEATNFLTIIESQLTKLCKLTSPSSSSPSSSAAPQTIATVSSFSQTVANDHQGKDEQTEISSHCYKEESLGSRRGELKEMLQRKYSGYFTNLRKEFLKKRKAGKLPKDATTTLLEWWTIHNRWPYPTEEEKSKLSETTILNHKQINIWFINQGKSHWKPSKDSRSALIQQPTTTTHHHHSSEGGGATYNYKSGDGEGNGLSNL